MAFVYFSWGSFEMEISPLRSTNHNGERSVLTQCVFGNKIAQIRKRFHIENKRVLRPLKDIAKQGLRIEERKRLN